MGTRKTEVTATKQAIYYVQCLSQRATSIGSVQFIPEVGPMPIQKEFYEDNEELFLHYEDVGTLSVDKPGTARYKGARQAAKVVASAIEAEDSVQAKYIPPKGLRVPVGGMGGVASPVAEAVAKESIRSAAMPDSELCIAQTKSGSQCKGSPADDVAVCKLHLKLIEKGSEVIGIDGEVLTLEDV